jgi:hypothetical protein
VTTLWLYVVWAIGGIVVFALMCGVALLVTALIARFHPRLLRLPADGDPVLHWIPEPSSIGKAELLRAIAEQCPVKPVAEDAVKVEGELDLQELADTINCLLARPA